MKSKTMKAESPTLVEPQQWNTRQVLWQCYRWCQRSSPKWDTHMGVSKIVVPLFFETPTYIHETSLKKESFSLHIKWFARILPEWTDLPLPAWPTSFSNCLAKNQPCFSANSSCCFRSHCGRGSNWNARNWIWQALSQVNFLLLHP